MDKILYKGIWRNAVPIPETWQIGIYYRLQFEVYNGENTWWIRIWFLDEEDFIDEIILSQN